MQHRLDQLNPKGHTQLGLTLRRSLYASVHASGGGHWTWGRRLLGTCRSWLLGHRGLELVSLVHWQLEEGKCELPFIDLRALPGKESAVADFLQAHAARSRIFEDGCLDFQIAKGGRCRKCLDNHDILDR